MIYVQLDVFNILAHLPKGKIMKREPRFQTAVDIANGRGEEYFQFHCIEINLNFHIDCFLTFLASHDFATVPYGIGKQCFFKLFSKHLASQLIHSRYSNLRWTVQVDV